MPKPETSLPLIPRSSSKRKVSGPSSEPKRLRSNEIKLPTDNYTDAPLPRTHFLIPQFVTNGLRRLSYVWSGAKTPSPRINSPRGGVVSEAALAAAEEAEVTSVIEVPEDVSDLDAPLSLPNQPLGGGHIRIPSPVNIPQTLSLENQQISPAHELRGHIRCRFTLNTALRSELHGRSVLHSSDFDDMYRQYCNKRDLKVDYLDKVPNRLFSSVVSAYGDRLGHVCCFVFWCIHEAKLTLPPGSHVH